MEIVFDTPKELVVTPEVKQSFTSITVTSIIDMPIRRLVVANTTEGFQITLWDGDDYISIGQWTDTDVLNRINEIYP